MKVTCIVASAGKGIRLNSKQDKPFVFLGSKPILAHTLRVLDNSRFVDNIVVVVLGSKLKACRELIKKYRFRKVQSVVAGGRRRLDSVRNGISQIKEADLVMVHDGVRPFIDENLIKRIIAAAKKHGAALCATPAKQTLKMVTKSLLVESTPERKFLWNAQTPQVFRKDLLREAYKRVKNRHATDDAVLVERLGRKVKVVRGSEKNIKITTPEDLELAKILLKQN